MMSRVGIAGILSIAITLPILPSDSDSYRFPFLIKNEVKHLDIKHIYFVSLFAKHLIAAEYHEQKSAGYIKTGLD